MLAAEQLIEKVRGYVPQLESSLILSAYEFSLHAHRDQMRKSGDPYFVHPASVAGTLADMRLDVDSICAGLLHDVVEDTDTSLQDLERAFGGDVAELVDGLTKLNRINFVSKEDQQAESFRKMVVAMSRDVRVLLIKLCDRLDNMRTMQHMKPASQERICRETMEIYAPLANRLGMHRVKSELEDLALRYLEPDAHSHIQEQLAAGKRERDHYITGVSQTITRLLSERGFAAAVQGAPRHAMSVHRKMQTLKCEFEQVYDLITFEVCVESVSDCYTTLGVLHSRWTPVPGRFKDFIALPKPNRYQSLHTTVVGPGKQRLEVQIRTHEMHSVAERGVLAQWPDCLSVSGRLRATGLDQHPWLSELESYQKQLKDPAEFLDIVKGDLSAEEISVFTPDGDVRVFPRGATPIDFAYSVHSELGDHCSAARANGQDVSIRYRLRNGDVVEVQTSPAATPSKDWLDHTRTARARNRIRAYLRGHNRRKSINLGKELLEREMHAAGMSAAKLAKDSALLESMLTALGAPSWEELMLALGFGKLQPHQVVAAVRQLRDLSNEPLDRRVPGLKEGPIERLVRKVKKKDSAGIRVDGSEEVLIRFSQCCNPVPGDPILGFMTRGRGVAVHRRDCKKAFDTTDPARRVEISWGPSTSIRRPVSLCVTTRNSPGTLARVSQAFSTHKINLSEANCRASDDGSAQNTFTFLAEDLEQLRGVMKALSRVQGVVSVERT